MTELEAKAIAKALKYAYYRNETDEELYNSGCTDQWHACVNAVCAVLKQNIVLFDSEQFRQECGQYD